MTTGKLTGSRHAGLKVRFGVGGGGGNVSVTGSLRDVFIVRIMNDYSSPTHG